MDDVHQDVRVAGREAIAEEVSWLQRQPVRFQPGDVPDDMRKIEQHSLRPGRRLEHGLQHVTAPAADVGDGTEAGKLVGAETPATWACALAAIASSKIRASLGRSAR
jgi:hypothetical protein